MASSSKVGRAVRTRRSRYTCMESVLMITPPSNWVWACASLSASADLPLAVGPAIRIAGLAAFGIAGPAAGGAGPEILIGRMAFGHIFINFKLFNRFCSLSSFFDRGFTNPDFSKEECHDYRPSLPAYFSYRSQAFRSIPRRPGAAGNYSKRGRADGAAGHGKTHLHGLAGGIQRLVRVRQRLAERRGAAGGQFDVHAELVVLVLKRVGADVSVAALPGAVALRHRQPCV